MLCKRFANKLFKNIYIMHQMWCEQERWPQLWVNCWAVPDVFWKFTQLTRILHDHQSHRSCRISTLPFMWWLIFWPKDSVLLTILTILTNKKWHQIVTRLIFVNFSKHKILGQIFSINCFQFVQQKIVFSLLISQYF